MVDRREGWSDFLKSNFDKLLLTGLVSGFALLAYRAYHVSSAELAQFAVDNSKLFSGALLTLITGRLLQRDSGQTVVTNLPKPDVTPPAPPTTG